MCCFFENQHRTAMKLTRIQFYVTFFPHQVKWNRHRFKGDATTETRFRCNSQIQTALKLLLCKNKRVNTFSRQDACWHMNVVKSKLPYESVVHTNPTKTGIWRIQAIFGVFTPSVHIANFNTLLSPVWKEINLSQSCFHQLCSYLSRRKVISQNGSGIIERTEVRRTLQSFVNFSTIVMPWTNLHFPVFPQSFDHF